MLKGLKPKSLTKSMQKLRKRPRPAKKTVQRAAVEAHPRQGRAIVKIKRPKMAHQ
ncbi:hypothetical protein AXF42_Ash021263 [Apostasia shenzhenica]|uniref:Uncharacterized protein n=1 Tax=Apostasia shenzhenica TaxID=1088818 RepID=A0A2H9ZVR0_9ASPA|nr:hypothetical protein AXF42_Ash021263 [Apostasia shenzhenica]